MSPRSGRDTLSPRERAGVREPVSSLAIDAMERFMGSRHDSRIAHWDHEPRIPGGETPPSTAGGTPVATEGRYMGSAPFTRTVTFPPPPGPLLWARDPHVRPTIAMNGHSHPNNEGQDHLLPPTERASAQGHAPTEVSAELAGILETYLADLEAGRPTHRAELLARHPHLAVPLEEALAGLEFIHRAAPANPKAPVQLGDFRILREIGRGGMGVVYEAEQVSLKRRVALKVLRYGPVADEVAMQRFQREAETVGRLHHTNIVPIFAIGADDGVRYYAMQFIEGRDLGRVALDMRSQSGALDFRRIADWGLQASDALAHAHHRGVIHRDIKPSNLILDPENRIWLTDFGLARRRDDISLSLTGALLGTPRYMSPEQAAAARTPIDHRTDLYSLGATLYELVTGKPIFEAASAHEVIAKILHTEPVPPRVLAPDVPRDLETILLKCLAKEASRRYPTAQALTEDLRAFVAGRPIAARRPHALERTVRWVRQHRRLVTTAALSGAASVLLAAAGVRAAKSYTDARLGRLQLSTATSGALAEILDASGRTVVPLFPVPNEKPLALPAGSYQVRLSAPEALSETWPIDLAPRSQASHSLTLASRWLWPPQDLGTPTSMERVPLDDRSGFLVLRHPETSPGQPSQSARLRLIDGATAQPVWTEDLVFDASTLPGGELFEWQLLLTHWAVVPHYTGTRIGERVTDLDRDGAGDFILLSRASASILAVSGASGRVLWWHRSRPPLPPNAPADARWASGPPGRSYVVSYPEIADLDGDGIDDVVASFRSNDEHYVPGEGQFSDAVRLSYIAAISGRTGQGLWKRPVESNWETYATSSSGARFDTLAHPTLVRLPSGLAVVLPDQDRLRLWDARTGTPLQQAPPLGFTLERAPEFFTPHHGTPKPHALVTRRFVESDAHLELIAVNLETGSIAWRQTPLTVLGGVAIELDAMPRESFTPVNLENDDPTEVVTFTARHPSPNHWTFGVQVLDAATGQPRWETSLHDAEHPQSIPSDARFLPGPDLNRDGSREIVAIFPAYDPSTRQHGVLAVALSGADGSIVWRQHHPGIAGARSLAWWTQGIDRAPLLVTTTAQFAGGRSSTFLFDSKTGQIAHTLLEVRDVQIADLNGDGAPDLLHPVRNQNTLRWVAIRGQPSPAWKQLGNWRVGPDADADGTEEVYGLSGDTLMARSGQDGRPHWKTSAEFASPEELWLESPNPGTPPRPVTTPLVAAVQLGRASGPDTRHTYRSLAGFSPQDGRRLWTSPEVDLSGGSRSGSSLGWAYDYPRIDFVDLDRDGTAEVLASSVTDTDKLQLAVVSGTSGKVLWTTRIVDGAMAPDPRPAGAPIADFNHDGVLDLALILSPSPTNTLPAEATFRVDVRSGLDGKSLWPAPFPFAQDPRHIAWPEPTLGDLDGDDVPEVLVVRHNGYRDPGGYACELVVLDGRSGLVRWTWTWNAGFPAVWAPLVLASPDPSLRRVALGITVLDRGSFEIVVLDANGTNPLRWDIQLTSHRPDRGGLVWGAIDLDGDGTSELIYPNEGFLCAGFGATLEPRWRKRLSGPGVDGFRIVPMAPRPDHTDTDASLVLWAGHDVCGIQGSRGDIVWRGRAPAQPLWGNSSTPHLRLVPSSTTPSRPHLQFLPPLARSDATSIDETWPTTPDGRYETGHLP